MAIIFFFFLWNLRRQAIIVVGGGGGVGVYDKKSKEFFYYHYFFIFFYIFLDLSIKIILIKFSFSTMPPRWDFKYMVSYKRILAYIDAFDDLMIQTLPTIMRFFFVAIITTLITFHVGTHTHP